MAIPITVPRLGWNMEEGVFHGWLKKEGEAVRPGDALFSLEAEKSTQDIECMDSGVLYLAPDGPKEGDKVSVGAVIGYIAQAGEVVAGAAFPPSPLAGEGPGVGGEKPEKTYPQPSPARGEGEDTAASPAAQAPAERPPHHPAASPRARRAAREMGVDWTRVEGSGRTGRIRERDVRAAAEHTAIPQGAEIPISPTRRTIAERMTASLRSTAPVTLTTTADASNLVNLRNQFKAVAGNEVVPGYTDFLVKLVAAALQRHPLLTARWTGETIVPAAVLDVGVAVDAEAGLLVPVVRDVPSLSVRQVAARTRDLAERARRGTLKSAEMEGGAFTLTNLGAFGIDAFTPIINAPQCAILGVGRIQRRPAVEADRIAARDLVTLSLTFDHRIVDGAPAARFLQTLAQYVENPGPILMP